MRTSVSASLALCLLAAASSLFAAPPSIVNGKVVARGAAGRTHSDAWSPQD
jgi:hypothetical protein